MSVLPGRLVVTPDTVCTDPSSDDFLDLSLDLPSSDFAELAPVMAWVIGAVVDGDNSFDDVVVLF